MKKRRADRGGGRRKRAAASGGTEATAGTRLPRDFVARVLADLGPHEGEALLTSLRQQPQLGLRVNRRVGDVVEVVERLGWQARRLPWAPEGVLLERQAGPELEADLGTGAGSSLPASHPWHDAGAYYLQDPSAMGVVPVLDPQPGDRVLELAAAPGGKSTYVADRLAGTGHDARGKAGQEAQAIGIGRTQVAEGGRVVEKTAGLCCPCAWHAPTQQEGGRAASRPGQEAASLIHCELRLEWALR